MTSSQPRRSLHRGTGEYRTAQGEIAMRAEADEIFVRLVR
jgi:hypothetical protein